MRISSLPVAVLLFSAFILSACSDGDSGDSVWRSSKMEVVSTQTRYGTDSGPQYRRRLSLKVNGSDVENREISEKLFPRTSRCFSPFYGISDIRPLKDESVLALLSVHESACGKAQLVRLSVERGKLRVQHFDLSPFSKGRSGTEAIGFEDVHPRAIAPDTPYLEVQLAAQRDTRTEWVAVQVRQEMADSQVVQMRTIAIRLADQSLHDLGPGELIRFLQDDSVALMSHDAERDTAQAHVQFRAIHPVDGVVLDRLDLRLACFALADASMQDRAMWDLELARREKNARTAMLERTIKESETITTTDPKFPGVIDSLKGSAATAARELAELDAVSKEQLVTGKSLGGSTRWIHASAVSKALLDIEQTSVEWNAGQGKLELRVSPGLTRDPQCEEQHSRATGFVRLLAYG